MAFALSLAAFLGGAFAGSESIFGVLAGIFAVCTAFEGFLGFCLGCKMYALLPARLTNRLRVREVA